MVDKVKKFLKDTVKNIEATRLHDALGGSRGLQRLLAQKDEILQCRLTFSYRHSKECTMVMGEALPVESLLEVLAAAMTNESRNKTVNRVLDKLNKLGLSVTDGIKKARAEEKSSKKK